MSVKQAIRNAWEICQFWINKTELNRLESCLAIAPPTISAISPTPPSLDGVWHIRGIWLGVPVFKCSQSSAESVRDTQRRAITLFCRPSLFIHDLMLELLLSDSVYKRVRTGQEGNNRDCSWEDANRENCSCCELIWTQLIIAISNLCSSHALIARRAKCFT